jgi:hypothetical protein
MNLARSPSGSSGAGASAAGASSLVGSRMLLLYAAAAFAVGYVGSLWIQRGGSTASGHHPSGEAAHQQRLQGGGNEAALPPAQEGNTSAPSLPLMYVYPLPPDVYLGGIASTSVYREKDMKVCERARERAGAHSARCALAGVPISRRCSAQLGRCHVAA